MNLTEGFLKNSLFTGFGADINYGRSEMEGEQES